MIPVFTIDDSMIFWMTWIMTGPFLWRLTPVRPAGMAADGLQAAAVC
jgi:hypothetical protein